MSSVVSLMEWRDARSPPVLPDIESDPDLPPWGRTVFDDWVRATCILVDAAEGDGFSRKEIRRFFRNVARNIQD